MKAKKVNALGAPRIFTYDQLVRIINENYKVLNRSVDPKKINKKGIFVLNPIMIHYHAFGKPIDPHLRVYVLDQSDKDVVGIQDLTFEQFNTGKVAGYTLTNPKMYELTPLFILPKKNIELGILKLKKINV